MISIWEDYMEFARNVFTVLFFSAITYVISKYLFQVNDISCSADIVLVLIAFFIAISIPYFASMMVIFLVNIKFTQFIGKITGFIRKTAYNAFKKGLSYIFVDYGDNNE